MARLFATLFSIVVLATTLSHATAFHKSGGRDTEDLDKRACQLSQPSFQNGGFESRTLGPWSWTWTNHSVPMTAKKVDHGYKSSHSVEIHANVIPWSQSPSGAQHNNGWLRQHFKICNNKDHYRVSWYYYQVPGGTTYNDEIEDQREFSVFMIYPNKYYQWLGDFTLYKTYSLCGFCTDESKHLLAGKWYEFHGEFYSSEVGEYTIELRSEVAVASYGGKHNVETMARIDNINIKKIS